MLNRFKFRRWRQDKGIDKEINKGQAIRWESAKLDVMLIDSKTGQILGRPWMTVGVDAYTKYVVGAYLSFEMPVEKNVSSKPLNKNERGANNACSKNN